MGFNFYGLLFPAYFRGGFLLYHDHKSDLSVAYDFRETAPASASETMLDNVPDLVGLAFVSPL